MSAFRHIFGYARSGKDNTGLGQWSWMVLDSGYKRTRFITNYRPVKKGSTKRRGVTTQGVTVWEQQWWYFCEMKGMVDLYSIELFNKDLFALIKLLWLYVEEIVLMIDANKNVYKGTFATAIAEKVVKLKDDYGCVHNKEITSSHVTRSKALMNAFV